VSKSGDSSRGIVFSQQLNNVSWGCGWVLSSIDKTSGDVIATCHRGYLSLHSVIVRAFFRGLERSTINTWGEKLVSICFPRAPSWLILWLSLKWNLFEWRVLFIYYYFYDISTEITHTQRKRHILPENIIAPLWCLRSLCKKYIHTHKEGTGWDRRWVDLVFLDIYWARRQDCSTAAMLFKVLFLYEVLRY